MAKKYKSKPPHLIAEHGVIRCSVCGMPFPPDKPSLREEAFLRHVSKAHRPGQTTEDFSQAAVRVVKESTDR